MGKPKRTSSILAAADKRLAGLKSIDENLVLESVSVASLQAAYTDLKTNLDEYNRLLSLSDERLNKVIAGERTMRDQLEKVLIGVASRYGKDSHEYEKAGGTRKSERKKPVRKAKP